MNPMSKIITEPIMTIDEIMEETGQTREDLERVKTLVRSLYKDDKGEPFEMTDGQACIFDCIYRRLHPKVIVLCYTQYGKSSVVSLATLTRVSNFAERWAIVGATKDKAEIIMKKLISHIFDNEYTKSKLDLGGSDSKERLRHSRSRERLTFRIPQEDGTERVGEIFVLSADSSKTGGGAGETLVGHGAPNIIVDDTPLMDDTVNGKLMRMLGGHKDHFILKIGNALKRNHFYRGFNSDRYKKIVIDHNIGIQEGRQSVDFFEDMMAEMNSKIMFDSFYRCIFPPEDASLDGIWTPLLTETQVRRAMEWEKEPKHVGELKLGADVADSGIDHDVIVSRSFSYAEILHDTEKSDQMTLAGNINIIKNDKEAGRVYLDAVGVGAGVSSKLRNLGVTHTRVNWGGKTTTSSTGMFHNKKARMFWDLKKWIEQGGKLSKDERWLQLTKVHYSVNSGVVKIMPKKTMQTMGIKSPDIADSLAMTFFHRDSFKPNEDIEETKAERFFRKKMKKNKSKNNDDYNLRMV